jgi:hypothetical protein
MSEPADSWTYTARYRQADDDPLVKLSDRSFRELVDQLGTQARVEIEGHGWRVTLPVPANPDVHRLTEATEFARQVVAKALWQSRMPAAALVHEQTSHDEDLRQDRKANQLMASAEVIKRLGITRQRLSQLRTTTWFPAPALVSGGHSLWRTGDIETFALSGHRRSGPKKQALRASVVSQSTDKMIE